MTFRTPLFLFLRFLFLFTLLQTPMISSWAECLNGSCLKETVDGLIQSVNSDVNVGVAVYSLTNQNWVYERNPDRLFVPSSAIKVLVAAAALGDMGPSYVFKSSLYIKESEHRPTSKMESVSDVYLELSGDPTLTSKDLRAMFDVLYQKGVRSITGNIFVEYVPRGELPMTPKSWMTEDLDSVYGTPPAPIIIDKNIAVQRVEVMGEEKPQLVARPLKDPLKNFSDKLMGLLKDQGFDVAGRVIYQAIPSKELHLVSDHTSKKLQEILNVAMKDSDNLLTDAIYIRLTSRRQPVINNWNEISKYAKNIIRTRYKVDLTKMNWMDGSGVSRLNLITPRQFVDVMNGVARNPKVSLCFSATLAQGGQKGTMKYRFTDPKIQPLIRAKTGTMTGDSSLVGFARTLNGEVLIFAIMINNFKGSASPYKRLEESICYALVGLNAPDPR